MAKVLITDSGLRTGHIGEAIQLLESNGCELVYEQVQPGHEFRLYPHLCDAFAGVAVLQGWPSLLHAVT